MKKKVQFTPLNFIVRYSLRSKTEWTYHNGKRYPKIDHCVRKALRHSLTEETIHFDSFDEAVKASEKLVAKHQAKDQEREVHEITIVSHTKIAKGHEL